MRSFVLITALIVALAVTLVLAHLVLIEVGREVVTLRTQRPDGTWKESRLWIVDDGASSWLHSGGTEWRARVESDPVVELERGGEIRRYRAHAVPGPHPHVHELMRQKYGVADRWVRFIGPDRDDTLAVRLDPLD